MARVRLSLRNRLLVAFVAMLVPVMALLAYELHADYTRRVSTVLAGQVETAGAVAALTDAVFDEGLAVSRAIAAEPELASKDPTEVAAYLRSRKDLFAGYLNISLVDTSGTVVASSVDLPAGQPRPSVADRPYFQKLIATGEETVSDVVVGRLSSEPIVAFAAPVRDSSGALRGALVVTLELSQLPDRLSHVQTSPGQAIVVADRTGRVAFATGVTFGSWEQRDLSGVGAVRRALGGEVVAEEEYSSPIFGDQRLAAFVPSPEHGWVAGVTQNHDAALAVVTAGVWRDSLAAIGLVVLAAALGLVLSRRLLVPIQRLTREASTLGAGLGRHGVDERQPGQPMDDRVMDDELATLTATFEWMSDEVRQRVGEIEAANARLSALMDAATTLVLQTSTSEVADVGVECGRRIIESDLAGVWALDATSQTFRLLGKREPAEESLSSIPRTSDLPIARAAEERRVATVGRDEAADGSAASPLADLGIRHLVAVPLPIRRELVGVVAFGRRRDLAFSAADVQAAETLAGMLAVALDRARLFEDLRIALRVREEFLNLAAHELRTPLTTLKGYVQLLERRGGYDEDARRLIRALNSQTNRMRQLVDTLIDVSQLQSGSLVLHPRPVGLGQLAETLARELEQSAPNHRLVVRCEQEVFVSADRARLREVIFSLLDNALKYSPRGGTVEVVVSEAQEEGIVSVRDEGIGIPAEKQAELFQAFFQVAPMVRPTTGMGLGLYISREIVRMHGGRIWFESEAGRGSTFSFALPRLTAVPLAEVGEVGAPLGV